jgi:hypothetical protein
MKKKIYLLSSALLLTLALVALMSGFAGSTAASASSNAASALPASDVVVTIDTQRLMAETLPTIFADKPALLAKVNGKIEQFNKETGIDLRTFESVAVGLRFTAPASKDFDAVVVARGRFNSQEVIDAAFNAAKSKHEFQRTEEQYEGKTIHVVSPSRRADAPQAKAKVIVNSTSADDAETSAPEAPAAGNDATSPRLVAKVEGPQSSIGEVKGSSDQMAIVALDANTLAFGELKGVRAAIDASMGRGRVDDSLVQMATQNASALIGFSGRIPPSMTEKLAGGKGVEAKYFASIREFYGSFGTVGTDTAEAFIAVRTENAGQATDISQALNALKLLGGFGLAQPAKGEARSIAGLLKDLSISSQDNEVQIRMNVKQKDLAPLMKDF